MYFIFLYIVYTLYIVYVCLLLTFNKLFMNVFGIYSHQFRKSLATLGIAQRKRTATALLEHFFAEQRASALAMLAWRNNKNCEELAELLRNYSKRSVASKQINVYIKYTEYTNKCLQNMQKLQSINYAIYINQCIYRYTEYEISYTLYEIRYTRYDVF